MKQTPQLVSRNGISARLGRMPACSRAGRQSESDAAAGSRLRPHESVDGFDEIVNIAVVAFYAMFEFPEFQQDLLVGSQGLAHANKGANDEDAHLDCTPGIQNRCGHDDTVFGEGVGQVAAPTAPQI